jgi:gliding motility-associated-like protein
MANTFTNFISRLLLIVSFLFTGSQGFAQYAVTTLSTGGAYTAMAKDQRDNIYVVRNNGTNYEVAKYAGGDPASTTVIYTGLNSGGAGSYPWGLAVNSRGDVFVTNVSNWDGWEIIKLTAPSYTPDVIHSGDYYSALAVDAADNLLSMEYNAAGGGDGTYRLVRYPAGAESAAGTTLYDGLAYDNGSLSFPWGIVMDSHSNIFLLDFLEHSGGGLIKLTYPGYAATVLSTGKLFTSLAVDASDNIYTTEKTSSSTAAVVKYTDPAGVGMPIYSGLSSTSYFYSWGLAVNSSGEIYVNDGAAAGNGRVLRLDPPTSVVRSVLRAMSSPTNVNVVTYTVKFNKAVTGITTASFSLTTTGLTGAAIGSVSGSGDTYTVAVNTGTGDGTIRLNVTGTGVTPVTTNVPYTTGEVYTIDKTSPTGSLSINSDATITNNATVTLTTSASDASGTIQMRFSHNGISWSADEALAVSKNWTLSAGDGLKNVYVQYVDAAGNVAGYNKSITLDQTAPETTITGGPANPTNSQQATFSFSSDDAGAGFEYSFDGSGFIAIPGPSPYSFSGIAEGTHTMMIRAKDAAGNVDATPGTYTWTVDLTSPVVSSVSVPANGYYKAGDNLNFTVRFSEPVVATGTPYLAVTIGSAVVHAALISSTDSSLTFSYTVANGDMDMDGIIVSTLNGTIKDAAGNIAALTLNNVGNTTGVFVNTTQVTITVSTTAASLVNAPYTAKITFSDAVTGFIKDDITVTNATLSNLVTSDNITYTVLVTPLSDGNVSLSVPDNVAVNIGNNGNSISDTITNTYDGTAPTVIAVDVPANGYYKDGNTLYFIVHFSESVKIDSAIGKPYINIVIGSTTVKALYNTMPSADAVKFSYTVLPGQSDLDGISIGSLSGSITDPAGNSAVLTLNNAGSTANVFVKTSTPAVALTATAAASVNGMFPVTVVFSEAVTGLVAGDFAVTNGTAANLQTTDNITYTIDITPAADGEVSVYLPADVAVNVINNGNTVSDTVKRAADITAPVITAGQAFTTSERSPVGTLVGNVTAIETAGTLQNWTITNDGSGGAFSIDNTGAIHVKDAAILASHGNNTVNVTITVSDGLNNSIPAAIAITIRFVNQAPVLDKIENVVQCLDVEPHTVQLTGASAVETDQTYSLSVSADKADFDMLAVNAAGLLTYRLKATASGITKVTVTIRDDGGTNNGGVDTSLQAFTITVNSLPVAGISSDKGTTISKGDVVQLTAAGGSTYVWDSGETTDVVEVMPAENTTYKVTVTNAEGCTATAEITIKVVEDFKIDAVNLLTPNGDGKNDKWVIRNLESYPNNEVKIYDRAGRMVYSRRNYSNDWDGTMNGSPLAEGTYYYILMIDGGKTAKVFITIIRDRN